MHCGAPFEAHGPAPMLRCDPDAAVYAAVVASETPAPPAPVTSARADASADKPKDKTKLALAATILVGVISAGAMASSCVNSGINYRQMRALETIAQKCSK
jgi:hypothetical protein